MLFNQLCRRFSVYDPPFPSRASEAATCLFQHSSFQKVILDELFGFSLLRCSSVFSSLVSDLKIYPSNWSCVHCGFAADFPQCRSPILETTMRGLVQFDLLKHWNESTDCKDVSTSIRRSSMRILRDGEMDCAGCPQCGVLSSNLYSRELRTAGLTPHFHAELL